MIVSNNVIESLRGKKRIEQLCGPEQTLVLGDNEGNSGR